MRLTRSRALGFVLLLLLLRATAEAAAPRLAVIGFDTRAPSAADCDFIGCGVADGVCSRLARAGTGIVVVERAEVAQVLRLRGLPPIATSCAQPAVLTQTLAAVRTQPLAGSDVIVHSLSTDTDGTSRECSEPTATKLLGASHLLVGSVAAVEGLGTGRTLVASVRLVEVATGTVIAGGGVTVEAPATTGGCQELEAGLASEVCRRLHGRISAVDTAVDEARELLYAQLAQARRRQYEGRYDETFALAERLSRLAPPTLCEEIRGLVAAAWAGKVRDAERAVEAATTPDARAAAVRLLQTMRQQQQAALQASFDEGRATHGGDAFRLAEALSDAEQEEKAVPLYREALANGRNDGRCWFGLACCLQVCADLRGAVEAYTRGLELDPDNAEAYNNRGVAYDDLGDHSRACADLTEALRLDPDNAGYHSNRGVAYSAQKEYARALEDYDAALRLDPGDATAHSNRGFTCQKVGRGAEAMREYGEAIRLDPAMPRAYLNRGHLYVARHQSDAAIEDFTTAIRLAPELAEGYRARGIVYAETGRAEEAIRDCTEAIRLEPRAMDYSNRGLLHDRAGRQDKALRDYTEALRLEPESSETLFNRALLYRDRGNLTEAMSDCTKAIRLDPTMAEAIGLRADIYDRQGQPDRALADYTEALRLEPNLTAARGCRGALYIDREEYDAALADLNEAVRLSPNEAWLYLNRGVAYADKGDDARAFADYAAALERDPKLASAYGNRGRLHLHRGETAEAIADLDRALQLEPGANDYSYRAKARLARKEYAEAIRDASEALRLDPDNKLAASIRKSALAALAEPR